MKRTRKNRPKGAYRELIEKFIESDIAVAQVIDDAISEEMFRKKNVCGSIKRNIEAMGFKGILDSTIIGGKIYIVNYTKLEV